MADLGQLLAGALGEQEALRWTVRSVDHRPGRRTTTAYDVVVPGGRTRVVVVTGDEAWRFPYDPELPGLAAAVDERRVVALLRSLGVDSVGATVRARSYRPRRRALVEVEADGLRLFLKVLRPPVVPALHERHRLLRGSGLPVPRSLGHSDDGVLVLEALPGSTLRARLRHGGTVPQAVEVLALLDHLPAQLCELPRRTPWTGHVAHYAQVLGEALPAEAERARQIADRVLRLVDDAPGEQPTHGDLHDGQLLLEGAGISGLLDLDGAGPGRRADDLACLLAHAEVLAAHAVVRDWERELAAAVDPAELHARVAGVLVSLATGPYRVQADGWPQATSDRLELAERWLAAAERGGPAPVASPG